MIILGVNGGEKRAWEDDVFFNRAHDAAAVLWRDGEVIAAFEEERLDRIKHSNCFPANAIRECLQTGGVQLPDVDWIAVNGEAATYHIWALRASLESSARAVPTNAAEYVSGLFEQHCGFRPTGKLRFCHHHQSHAWSAYALSGYDEALVLSLDGIGDNSSGMVLRGSEGRLEVLRTFSQQQSLGLLYLDVIKLLGFNLFDEYKSMGLAPYGSRETFRGIFEGGCRLLADGQYEIESSGYWISKFRDAGLFSRARRQGEAFTQGHMDLAAGIQEAIETTAMHVLRHFAASTGLRDLCMAGGVAHNCSLTGKVLYEGPFERVFVQPASHDAGGALGAALSVAFEHAPEIRPRRIPSVYFGSDLGSEADIEQSLTRWGPAISVEHPGDSVASAADLLAGGAIIGWVQGRSEFGPRALGNRSILGDPRPAENKDRINRMIKKRETYRPFAPSVLEERIGDVVEMPPTQADLDYMTYVLRVKPEMRPKLGAVTHVDGTARVQTVSRQKNRNYWELISAFLDRTGIPVLLNTSFNVQAEPIVETLDDAVACFLTSGLDCLIAGGFVVRRSAPAGQYSILCCLAPSLPGRVRLEIANRPTCACGNRSEPQFALAETKGSPFRRRRRTISPEMFALLSRSDGATPVSELCGSVSAADRRSALLAELTDLWSERMLLLHPAN